MIARELPRQEWPRLEGTEAETLWPHLNPENTRVLVVEDEGRIVGTWLMLRVVHAECMWIAPDYRGSFGVAKRLLKGMRDTATEWGVPNVVTGSVDPHVTDLIRRLGGYPMPCESFVLPVRKPSDQERGRAFHAQLAAQVSEGLHPDDEQHDEQVGKALRTAIEAGDPDGAMAEYNAWAVTAGYEPITYLGVVDGKLRADIVTAVVEIDDRYGVRVVAQEESCHS